MSNNESKTAYGWSAPCLTDPDAVCAQLAEYRLVGRTISTLRMGGSSHFHTRSWIEGEAYARLEGLPEEERVWLSSYVNIPGDMLFECSVLTNSTFAVEFMDGKALVVASPGEPVFRMSSNPYDRDALHRERENVSADELFACCCSSMVRDVKVNTRMAERDPLTGTPYDVPREVVSSIELVLEDGVRLQFRPWGHFLMVRCVDAEGRYRTIDCHALRQAVMGAQNVHEDSRIEFTARGDKVFCGIDGAAAVEGDSVVLTPCCSFADEEEDWMPPMLGTRLYLRAEDFAVIGKSMEERLGQKFGRDGCCEIEYADWMADLRDAEQFVQSRSSAQPENAEFWAAYRIMLDDIRRWSEKVLRPNEVLAVEGCPTVWEIER